MSSKKKIIVTISAFIMLVVAAVVSVVAVLAAQKVNIQSTISISYTAKYISATVTASYTIIDDDSKTSVSGINNWTNIGSTITFNESTEHESTSNLTHTNINYTQTSSNTPRFVLRFQFNGKSTVDSSTINAKYTVANTGEWSVNYATGDINGTAPTNSTVSFGHASSASAVNFYIILSPNSNAVSSSLENVTINFNLELAL